MKMLGNTAVRCSYGCCRVYGTPKGKRAERRQLKRAERQKFKQYTQYHI